MNRTGIGKLIGAAAVAVAGVVAVDFIGDALVRPSREQVAVVTVPERAPGQQPGGGEQKKEEQVEPIAPLLASASVEEGAKVAKKCHACHTLEKGGPNKVGPNLWNVVMNDKGHHPDFSYSSAMQEAEGKWTYEDLNKFLHDPREFIPGTKMTFPGVKDAKERAAVIAYLRTLSDSPAPLPKTGS